MKKTALLAIAAALPLALAAPARADTGRGDYQVFHRSIAAPRVSIDVLPGGTHRAGVQHGDVYGSMTSVRIADVRTVKQSKRFVQFFVLHVDATFDGPDHRFMVRRGGKVYNADNGTVCAEGTATFNDAKNTVSVFLPDSCALVTASAQMDTTLIDKKTGFVLAKDTGDLYEY